MNSDATGLKIMTKPMSEDLLLNRRVYLALVLCLCIMVALAIAHYPIVSTACFFVIALGIMLPFEWLTWLVIAIAPLQFAVIGLQRISYKVSYFDAALLLLIISFAWNVANRKLLFFQQRLVLVLALFCVVGLISLLPAGFPPEGVHYLLRLVAVLVVFISVIHFVREQAFAWSLLALFVCLWMVVIVAVINAVHGMETLGATVRAVSEDPQALARIGSIYNQPNVTGHTLAVFLPMCFGFAFLLEGKPMTRFLLVITAIFLGCLLILTRSRGAMITGGVGLVILTFYLRRFPLLLILLALCGFLILNLSYISKLFLDVRAPSLEGRLDLFYYGLKIAREHPILGVGLRQFSIHLYDVPLFIMGRSSHNVYLEVLVETGILGFGVFFVFIVLVWRRLVSVTDGGDRSARLIRGIGVSTLASVLCTKLFTGGLLLVTWWIALGIVIGFTQRSSFSNSQRSKYHLMA